MIHSPELRAFVLDWEGCKLKAYKDGGGVWTIGVGHTRGVEQDDACTFETANEWLDDDLREHGAALEPYMTRVPSQQQYDALLSLAFNCGVRGIGESGVMARFNAGLHQECADRFLMWNKDNGSVVRGLTMRRAAERAIYLDGDYSHEP
jgi:lysozyme